jgi:hypothetical protein
MPKKKVEESEKVNPEYNEIIERMIDMIGGKEYCLRQLLFEEDHKKFINKYRESHRDSILKKISKFYESVPFNESNIVDIETSSGAWNKYILKIFFYDKKNYRIFDYSIKYSKVEEVSLFEIDDDDETKNYSRSFFSKLKGGNQFWNEYNKMLEEKNSEDQTHKLQKEKEYFVEKMKKFKFIPDDDSKDIELEELEEQLKDGKTRYELDNKFYYRLVGINGYITFNEEKDIMLEPAFAKYFYEKIVKKLREE